MDNEEKRLSKIKVRDIIDDLNEEELKAFVSNYSRHDQMFEWTLKSHFISRIDLGSEGEKYKRILDELVRPRTNRNSKISSTHAKALAVILKDFAQQMFDCLSTQDYTEAYYLSYHALNKTLYLQQRYKVKNKSIEQSRQEFLKGIDLILSQDLAPLFRQKVESSLQALVLTSYYYPEQNNLIKVLDQNNCLGAPDKEEIIRSLSSKYPKAGNQGFLLKTIIQLAFPITDLAVQIVQQFGQRKIYDSFKLLIDESAHDIVYFYLDNERIGYEYNREVLLTRIAAANKDHKTTTRYLQEAANSGIPILELKELLAALPDEYFVKAFSDLRHWVDTLQFDIKSDIYARAHRYEGLIKCLHDENDFDWLTVYDELLIHEGYQAELGNLYQNIAINYLDTHLGRKATQFIEKLNARLIHLHQRPMLDRIHKALNQTFSHRKSIKSLIT